MKRRFDSVLLGGALALSGIVHRRVGDVDRRVDELTEELAETKSAPPPSPKIPGMPLPTGYGLQVRGPASESILLPICLPPGFELDSMMLVPEFLPPGRGQHAPARAPAPSPHPARRRSDRASRDPLRGRPPPDPKPSAARMNGVLQLVFGSDQTFSSTIEHSEDTQHSEPTADRRPSRTPRAASEVTGNGHSTSIRGRVASFDDSWRHADTVVVGGGTSGPAVAGLLAEGSSRARARARGRARLRRARLGALARRPARRARPADHPRLGLRLGRPVPGPRDRLRAGARDRRLLGAQRLRGAVGQPGRLRRLGGERLHGLDDRRAAAPVPRGVSTARGAPGRGCGARAVPPCRARRGRRSSESRACAT